MYEPPSNEDRGPPQGSIGYLTIRPVARKGYEWAIDPWPLIAYLVKDWRQVLLIASFPAGSNCFSITQLVGQKKQ